MNAIIANNLYKRYGQSKVLCGLNLKVKKGSLFALLGPNGSGKSTLIKTLTGILKPDEGEVLILGKSIVRNSYAVKKITGVLPESMGLFSRLTILEHLTLSGDIYGIDQRETTYRAEQLLRKLDLWKFRNMSIGTASFGMKKKCSLAMVLIHNPKVIFLDEPFEGIDPISSKVFKEIFSLLVKKGVTIFLTSHIIDTIEKIVDSFAIIQQGKIVCKMTLDEIISANSSLETIYFNLITEKGYGDLRWLES